MIFRILQGRAQTLITVVLVALFLASVPVVLLTTAGYRINLRTRQLERSGILILRSAPADAQILLDGARREERTPARLTDLLPREYRVTLEREGFRPWSKSLTVESQRSTFAENIVLFPDQLPVRVADASTTTLALSEDGTIRLATTSTPLASPNGLRTVLDGGRVRVSDTATGALVTDREARGAIWRTDGTNELLLWSESELWTVGTDGNATLLTRLGAPIRAAAWYPGGSHVLYASGDTLSAIERDDRSGRVITPLFTLPDLGTFVVNEKGAAIFATAAPAGKPGIFRYPIVIP